ncbi:MAG: hypothetical protein KF754_00600 [Planctomycetes bacterium]|nr:hypothetical protein [Planctomycetota bacterium]
MGIPVFQFEADRIQKGRMLFPVAIERDGWVIFHGTSAGHAASIEQHGFDPKRTAVRVEDVRRVVAIYQKLRWAGRDTGGFAVLKPFSLESDFRHGDTSPIFFAETSMRALLYASRDFAGGEKVRALRRALADLDLLMADPQFRQERVDYHHAERQELERLGAHPASLVEVKDVDLNWLSAELSALSDVREMVEKLGTADHPGVVYALRVCSEDVASLGYCGSMGIRTSSVIPASRIIGKVLVPPDYVCSQVGRTAEDFWRHEEGLLPAIRSASPGRNATR